MSKKRCISLILVFAFLLGAFIPANVNAQTPGSEDAKLVAHYDFEDISQGIVDKTGNGNNGAITGTLNQAEGMEGNALKFDGASGYVNIPNSESLAVTGEATFELWINPDVYGTGQYDYLRLIDKISEGDSGFLVDISPQGKIRFIGGGKIVHSAGIAPIG